MDIVDDYDLNDIEYVTPNEYIRYIWLSDPAKYSQIFDDKCGTNLIKLSNNLFNAKNKKHLAIIWDDIEKVFRNLPEEAIKVILNSLNGDDDGFDL